MSLERRDGGVYHYTHRRVGRRVVKEYDGSGQLALLGAELLAADQEMRRQKAIDRKVRRDVRAAREAGYRDWLAGVAAAVADALRAAGWHQHNREWRRKRGATMSGLATTFGAGGAPTWHGDRLREVSGELPDEVEAKARAGDESARPAVDEYLSTPEAAALWGDVGRRVLVKWAERYAGGHLATERALYQFAADLRDRLAGPTPSALEVLLAERVVVGWVFVNYCESAYLNALDKLTWDVSKCHTQRIELAHRTLMAACATLAKVRRAKLPDLLALVNVSPQIGR